MKIFKTVCSLAKNLLAFNLFILAPLMGQTKSNINHKNEPVNVSEFPVCDSLKDVCVLMPGTSTGGSAPDLNPVVFKFELDLKENRSLNFYYSLQDAKNDDVYNIKLIKIPFNYFLDQATIDRIETSQIEVKNEILIVKFGFKYPEQLIDFKFKYILSNKNQNEDGYYLTGLKFTDYSLDKIEACDINLLNGKYSNTAKGKTKYLRKPISKRGLNILDLDPIPENYSGLVSNWCN